MLSEYINFRRIVFFVGILSIFILLRLKVDFPITLEESHESYSAYSILLTSKDADSHPISIYPKAAGINLNTLSVYLKVITIKIFSLNYIGVRLPSIIAAFLCIIILYLILKKLFKDPKIIVLGVFLFTVSPILLYISLFKFEWSLTLLLNLLYFYFFLNGSGILLSLLLSVSMLFVPEAAVTGFIFLLQNYFSSKKRRLFILPFIAFIFIMAGSNPRHFWVQKMDKTILSAFKTDNYKVEIDKKLSFGHYMKSPLLTDRINFNRIAHNKYFYTFNGVLKSFIYPFNLEYLSFSYSSRTVLANDKEYKLIPPQIFLVEYPLIILGVVYYHTIRKKEVTLLLISGIIGSIFFGNKIPYMLLPVIVIYETTLFMHIAGQLKRFKRLIFAFTILFLWGFAYKDFYGKFKNEFGTWTDKNDYQQYLIWKSDLPFSDFNKVYVTDRLGEPVFYYLYYQRVNPVDFFSDQARHYMTDIKIERIDRVGKVNFGSFDFTDSVKEESQLWIGLSGEFLGKNADASSRTGVNGGTLLKRIRDDNLDDKFFGNELWFVKT